MSEHYEEFDLDDEIEVDQEPVAEGLTYSLGSLWPVPDPALITKPDGSTVKVVGGSYVLHKAGEYREANGSTAVAQ